MPVVTVTLPHHRYDVLIEPGSLDGLGATVARHAPPDRCALIGDRNVMKLYGDRVHASLRQAGYTATVSTIAPGEEHKSLDTVRAQYDAMLNSRLERRSPVVALGGGVI